MTADPDPRPNTESGAPARDRRPPDRYAAAAAGRQALAYRILGACCALVGILLVVGGLIAVRGKPATPSAGGSGSQPDAAAVAAASTTAPATATPHPAASSPSSAAVASPTAPPATTVPAATTATTTAAPQRAELTVLNNTTTAGLAERAAATFRAGGWAVRQIGNYTGKIPTTTVYYTPGNSAEEAAARALAAQFTLPRVLPRYAGLPEVVRGVVVVLAPDWRP